MPVDENYWPGPTWNFTIHEKGFPAHPVDGDLYFNQFGLRYICIRGQYNLISEEEWNDLLEIEEENLLESVILAKGVASGANFLLGKKKYYIREGDQLYIRGKGRYECFKRFGCNGLVLIHQDAGISPKLDSYIYPIGPGE